MECDLICNFKGCRKTINGFAWVTSCSHLFCDEDGTREFSKAALCPLCDNDLSAKLDVVRVDLRPSEQFKSMLLAGQKPEIIMEICSRAISFWTYQVHQELVYQEYCVNKNKDRATQLESSFEQETSKRQNENAALKKQLIDMRKHLDDTKRKYTELANKYAEKGRQQQRLQSMYDRLRRSVVTPNQYITDSSRPNHHRDRDLEARKRLGRSRNVVSSTDLINCGEDILCSNRPMQSAKSSRPSDQFPVKCNKSVMIQGHSNSDSGNVHNTPVVTIRPVGGLSHDGELVPLQTANPHGVFNGVVSMAGRNVIREQSSNAFRVPSVPSSDPTAQSSSSLGSVDDIHVHLETLPRFDIPFD